MKYILKTEDDLNLFEVKIWTEFADGSSFVDLECSTILVNYSIFLIRNKDYSTGVMSNFFNLNRLRDWLWKSFFMYKTNTASELENVKVAVKEILQITANRFDLNIIEER